MPTVIPRLCLSAALLLGVVIDPSHAAAEDSTTRPPTERPVASTLLAPVPCGIEIQGTTYGGHGRNNWNLDVNTTTAPTKRDDIGVPILAQADGTVVWFKTSGYNKGAGTYIEIDYGDVTARYVHLVDGSIPDHLAEIGATVRQGERIGALGETGRTTAPHLHLEYWDSAEYDDTPWYRLPRANHIPVHFEGVEMIARVGHPSPAVVSTNCPVPSREERLRGLRLWRYTSAGIVSAFVPAET